MKINSNKLKPAELHDVKDAILKSPVTKAVVVAIGILALIGISGHIFKLINFSVSNYKDMRITFKRP